MEEARQGLTILARSVATRASERVERAELAAVRMAVPVGQLICRVARERRGTITPGARKPGRAEAAVEEALASVVARAVVTAEAEAEARVLLATAGAVETAQLV